MIHDLSVKLAGILVAELKSGHSQAVIAYGLEVIIGALVKLVFFLALSLLLGIFPQVAAAYVASASFRLTAGGAHCTAFYRCLVGSLTAYLGIGLLARYLGGKSFPVEIIVISVVLLAAAAALRWAPADTPAKPITRPGHRKGLKIASLVVVTIFLTAGLLVSLPDDLVLAACMGLFFQTFTITPLGYRFMDAVDRLLLKTHMALSLASKSLQGLKKGGVKGEA